MSILIIIIGATVIFLLAYCWYDNYLSQKAFELDDKKTTLLPPKLIKFQKNSLFFSNSKQIIYIENERNEYLNDFFHRNYQEVNQLFERYDYNFVFIPKSLSNINEVGIEGVKYYCPNVNELNITKKKVSEQDIYNIFFSFLLEKREDILPGLIRYKHALSEGDLSTYTYLQITCFEDQYLWKQLELYLQKVGDGNGELRAVYKRTKCGEDFADESYREEVLKLTDEIKDRVLRLRQLGVNESILKSLFTFEESPRLSRLVITNDYKIILSDFNNMEIKMHPLPKAIFFLFLKHQDGIMFKHLPDYREELIEIYKKVATRGTIQDFQKSIDDVTDPTKNSINEKCARIREAFVKEFDEQIAQYYFILGNRITPKKIYIDRSLVTIEADL